MQLEFYKNGLYIDLGNSPFYIDSFLLLSIKKIVKRSDPPFNG